MKWRLALFFYALSIFSPVFLTPIANAESIETSNLLITEIKLGGDSYAQGPTGPKDPQEYITIFNSGYSEVSLNGWYLEYAKPTFDGNYCDSADWASHSVGGSASKTVLSGSLLPGGVSTPIVRSLNDNAAGSVHLVNGSSDDTVVIEDLVGWGSSAPCFSTSPTSTPSNGKSLQRYLACEDSYPIKTNDNSHDFAVGQPPSPNDLNYPYIANCQELNPPQNETVQTSCEGVIITEILPNPAGTDTGKEFIELYNSTNGAVSLSGCSLQTSAGVKTYDFPVVVLQAGEYKAIYDGSSGLTLPNSNGGTVWLLSSESELQEITYLPNLEDDVSWSYSTGVWQISYEPSPNAKNTILTDKPCGPGEERNSDTNRCRSVLSLTTSSLAPCEAGQERNPATNRCRLIVSSADQLKPCSPNQERNPLTNRCRNISSDSILKPCEAGQERNPATNRCRKIGDSTSQLKPCGIDQERNPDTNRCRNISSQNGQAKGMATVKDVDSGPPLKDPKWWLAGFATVGATSYGVYEWRKEIFNLVAKIRAKIKL